MTDNIINTGNTQLYNQIFCNFLPNNGFSTCQDCNYGNMTSYENANMSSEAQCLTSCQNDNLCTSYTFNRNNGSCNKYTTFPNQINSNPGTNSGYNLNFPYDYNSLSSQQQDNVEKKCADQYIDNYFGLNDVEMAGCMTVSNSGENTVFNIDPTCLANVYSNAGISINSVNSNDYQDNIISPIQTDPVIDQYIKEYESYMKDGVQIQNILDINPNAQTSSDPYWTQTMVNRTTPILKTQTEISDRSGIKIESFENFQNSSNGIKFVAFFILIIIFIILFYAFNKK